MKSYVLVMMCLMAGLVPSHAADAWKIPHDPELLSFLQRIETGYQQIRDLECELEETYVGPEGAKRLRHFRFPFCIPIDGRKWAWVVPAADGSSSNWVRIRGTSLTPSRCLAPPGLIPRTLFLCRSFGREFLPEVAV